MFETIRFENNLWVFSNFFFNSLECHLAYKSIFYSKQTGFLSHSDIRLLSRNSTLIFKILEKHKKKKNKYSLLCIRILLAPIRLYYIVSLTWITKTLQVQQYVLIFQPIFLHRAHTGFFFGIDRYEQLNY